MLAACLQGALAAPEVEEADFGFDRGTYYATLKHRRHETGNKLAGIYLSYYRGKDGIIKPCRMPKKKCGHVSILKTS
jgi:hypothetical protein